MHITVIAADFDGTISCGDQIDAGAAQALRRWREAGRFTVLVSGRPFEFIQALQARAQLFDLIVAENGAVIYTPRTDEMRLPFGEVPADLLETLERVGVPLWRGVAAAGTTARYDDAVWVASRELGRAVHVESNRGEVMLLPPGASKGAGLLALLRIEGLSPRNLIAFGDAENDASLLGVAEVKVAVANAVDSLKALADTVTPEAGPAGVAHFIEHYLLDGKPFDFPVRGAHTFHLGTIEDITLNAHDVIDHNILITGGSGYGKTWMTSRLADGLIGGGYQLLALDPVGDLRALQRHATCLCLGFGDDAPPPINLVVQLLSETDLSLVIDLSRLPSQPEQVLYAAGLLRRVTEVHQRFGKPHEIIIDEAQDLLGEHDTLGAAQLPLLRDVRPPGLCLSTWQPSRLGRALLGRMDGCLLARQRLPDEVACLGRWLSARGIDATRLAEQLDRLSEGQALLGGPTPASSWALLPVRFPLGTHTFSQMRQLHRYLDEKVTLPQQFYFHEETGRIPPAGNLAELLDRLPWLDAATVTLHFEQGDFARWIRDVLCDEALARWLGRLRSVGLSGEALRAILIDMFDQRLRMLERLEDPKSN